MCIALRNNMLLWFQWVHLGTRRLQPYGCRGVHSDDMCIVRSKTHRRGIILAGANATKYIREHRREK